MALHLTSSDLLWAARVPGNGAFLGDLVTGKNQLHFLNSRRLIHTGLIKHRIVLLLLLLINLAPFGFLPGSTSGYHSPLRPRTSDRYVSASYCVKFLNHQKTRQAFRLHVSELTPFAYFKKCRVIQSCSRKRVDFQDCEAVSSQIDNTARSPQRKWRRSLLNAIYFVLFATGFGHQVYHAHSKIKSLRIIGSMLTSAACGVVNEFQL